MSSAHKPLALEPHIPFLDVLVKYSILATFLTYAAGLSRISGFLTSLGVPTEAGFFAPPTVFGYGSSTLFQIVLPAAVGLFALFGLKETYRQARIVAWLIPGLVVVAETYDVWRVTTFSSEKSAILYLSGAAYLLVLMVHQRETLAKAFHYQVVLALILFAAVTTGASYAGHAEAALTQTQRPTIQLLLAPELVHAASELGLTFSSTAEPALTDPVNVVVVSERNYYVWIPVTNLKAGQSGRGIELEWQHGSVAIPRDKVLLSRIAWN